MDIKVCILFLLFSFISLSVNGNKLTVYRWIDENNVVHFSQHQPDHDNYVEITMAGNNAAAPEQNHNKAIANSSKPSNTKAINNKVKENSDSLCETAKANLKTLKKFDNIQFKDSEGKERLLTPLEKKQQIAMNTKQVEVYCQQQ